MARLWVRARARLRVRGAKLCGSGGDAQLRWRGNAWGAWKRLESEGLRGLGSPREFRGPGLTKCFVDHFHSLAQAMVRVGHHRVFSM